MLKRVFLFVLLAVAAGLGAHVATAAVVTNTADGTPGSLRQIIANAAPGDTVTFATNLSGATILLNAGQLSLNNSVNIDASALPGGVQINGRGITRVFNVAGGVTVVLTALTITNGNDLSDAGGGGIYNAGNLTLNQCTLTANFANNLDAPTAGGGAIFNSGSLTLNQCTLAFNHSDNDSALDGGGAVYNSGTLNVNQCTLTANSADNGGGGGGIYNTGTLTIYNSIIAANSSAGISGADLLNSSVNASLNGVNIVEDINGLYSGLAPINADPQLAPLGNYGGPTLTLRPLPGSPAINACINSAQLAVDQRGVPRPLGVSDIGSVQLAPPSVATLPATAAVNTDATLNATINLHTLSGTAWFQWGASTDPYSYQTTPVPVGSGTNAFAFSSQLTTLTPGVVYHCRVLATNADGLVVGSDVLFGSDPVVTLFGTEAVTNECHTVFTDPGATNTLGLPVSVTGRVNADLPNVYQLTYTATNSLGLVGSAVRLVTVADTTPPVITLLGANPLTILANTPFVDPGATALDACGGSFAVTAISTVNSAAPGSYTVTYSSTDSYSNTATAVRTVVVRTHLVFITTTNDSGPGSLREAIANSFSGDDLEFAANLSGATILLTSGQLTITNDLTIDASALPGGIQINGHTNGSVLYLHTDDANLLVTLTSLTLTNGQAGEGGGVFNNGGTIIMNQCTVTGNYAEYGGGIYNPPEGTMTLNQCLLAGNYASNGVNAIGGGIDNDDGVLTMNGCTLTGNHADHGYGGGGIYNSHYGTVTVNNCTLAGNHADYDTTLNGGGGGGGGIFNDGLLTVNQCTLTENHADYGILAGENSGGGGIVNFLYGTLAVSQSTLTGNHADNGGIGGGILTYVYLTNGAVTLINSIIAGNSGSNADICNLSPGFSVGLDGANLIQDANVPFTGPAPISADPQLASLGNYGGPTPTIPPLPGSPAIDACDTSAFTTDQRGFPRLLGGFPDLGAVEGAFNPAGPGQLTGLTRLGNGSAQFMFTNFTDVSFTVLASTNPVLPMTLWTNLGHALESPVYSGQFQFIDPQASNYPRRFYRVRSP